MIEQGLVQLIQADKTVKAICPEGGYFFQLPEAHKKPSWTYAVISDMSSYTLQGRDGLTRYRIQIDIYGTSAADCLTLFQTIDNVISGYHGTLPDPDSTVVQGIFRDNITDFFDSDSRTYRRSVDYLIWFNQQ